VIKNIYINKIFIILAVVVFVNNALIELNCSGKANDYELR